MALQKQMVPLTFGGGLDTKTDQASVPLGKWLVLENARFVNPKSIRKRNGAASLGTGILTGGNVAAGSALASRSNELLLADGASLYSYDQANTSWVNKGALQSPTLSPISSLSGNRTLTGYDSAYHSSGLQCVVTEAHDDALTVFEIEYAIIDTTTGQQVVPLTFVAVGQAPKVVVLGNQFVIFWIAFNTNTLRVLSVAIATPQTLGTTTVITSGTTTSAFPIAPATCNYDVCVSNGEIYLAFSNRSGTTTVFGITSMTPYTQPHSAFVAGTAPQALCVCGNLFNNDVIVGYTETDTTAKAFAYNSILSVQTLAPTTIDTTTSVDCIAALSTSASVTAIQFYVGCGQQAVQNCFIRQNTLGAAYAVGTASQLCRSVLIAGKPFLNSGKIYLPAWLTGDINDNDRVQNTWFLLDSTGRPVAKAFPGSASGWHGYSLHWGGKYAMLPESAAVGGGIFSLPIGRTYQLVGSTLRYGVAVLRLSFVDSVNAYSRATLADSLLIGGAVPQMYDGSQVTEHGFLAYPKTVTGVNAAGGALAAATYQYVVTYEWQDAFGYVHRSTPSVAISKTVNLNDKVTLTIPTLRLTNKLSPRAVLIQVYRTQANGTTFFRITNTGLGAVQSVNDTTVDTVTYADLQSDAQIASNPQLYSAAELQAAAPPPLNSLIVHRNRIFGIDPTTGQVAYSKQIVLGSPVEFSAFLSMGVDARGGNPLALASLDEKLIIFKSDRIFMVLGQGPDATGQNNDFTDAVQVSTDTGCAAPKSIVVVPDGLMFKSPKGIYLLDRALRVSYIGADVEAHNSANVTSARLIPSTNEVRFSLDSGKVLVYDYRAEQWGVFTNISAADATIWGSQYTYLTAAGIASQETPGLFVDPGNTFIKMKAVSAWVQLAQIQGFQRIWRVLVLGQYKSAHQLTLKLAHDFSASFDQQNDITVASDPAPYQYRVHCRTQKSEALQISIEDVSTGTNGESMSLSGFMLEVGSKRGAIKLPASKSAG